MKKQLNKTNFGAMKFDKISTWKSKKGNLFFKLQIGKNSIFISENLLSYIKNQNHKTNKKAS